MPTVRVRQLSIGRDKPSCLLPRQGLLAHLVPALVELALVLGDPVLLGMMRRVGRTWRVVKEEWPVWRDGLLVAHPIDGLVGDVVVEVVVRIAQIRFDRLRAIEYSRSPLVGFSADESVELFEA